LDAASSINSSMPFSLLSRVMIYELDTSSWFGLNSITT
jgi:hypothetical protein